KLSTVTAAGCWLNLPDLEKRKPSRRDFLLIVSNTRSGAILPHGSTHALYPIVAFKQDGWVRIAGDGF
ncbi:MAG: hypothetical protein ACREQV_11235, partial [Candidatus Binatia bacterium]